MPNSSAYEVGQWLGNAQTLNRNLLNPTAVRVLNKQRIAMLARKYNLQSSPDWVQIADALNLLGFLFRARKNWQKHSRQNSDDGNNNQQLNHGQPVLILMLDGHDLFVGEVA
jgi:hypothetical protein